MGRNRTLTPSPRYEPICWNKGEQTDPLIYCLGAVFFHNLVHYGNLCHKTRCFAILFTVNYTRGMEIDHPMVRPILDGMGRGSDDCSRLSMSGSIDLAERSWEVHQPGLQRRQ